MYFLENIWTTTGGTVSPHTSYIPTPKLSISPSFLKLLPYLPYDSVPPLLDLFSFGFPIPLTSINYESCGLPLLFFKSFSFSLMFSPLTVTQSQKDLNPYEPLMIPALFGYAPFPLEFIPFQLNQNFEAEPPPSFYLCFLLSPLPYLFFVSSLPFSLNGVIAKVCAGLPGTASLDITTSPWVGPPFLRLVGSYNCVLQGFWAFPPKGIPFNVPPTSSILPPLLRKSFPPALRIACLRHPLFHSPSPVTNWTRVLSSSWWNLSPFSLGLCYIYFQDSPPPFQEFQKLCPRKKFTQVHPLLAFSRDPPPSQLNSLRFFPFFPCPPLMVFWFSVLLFLIVPFFSTLSISPLFYFEGTSLIPSLILSLLFPPYGPPLAFSFPPAPLPFRASPFSHLRNQSLFSIPVPPQFFPPPLPDTTHSTSLLSTPSSFSFSVSLSLLFPHANVTSFSLTSQLSPSFLTDTWSFYFLTPFFQRCSPQSSLLVFALLVIGFTWLPAESISRISADLTNICPASVRTESPLANSLLPPLQMAPLSDASSSSFYFPGLVFSSRTHPLLLLTSRRKASCPAFIPPLVDLLHLIKPEILNCLFPSSCWDYFEVTPTPTSSRLSFCNSENTPFPMFYAKVVVFTNFSSLCPFTSLLSWFVASPLVHSFHLL